MSYQESCALVLHRDFEVSFNILHIVLVATLLESSICGWRRIEAKTSASGHTRQNELLLALSQFLNPILRKVGNHLFCVQTESLLQVDLELCELLLKLRVEYLFVTHILHSDRHELCLPIRVLFVILILLVVIGAHAMLISFCVVIKVVLSPLELRLKS
jgi:hypothetical protein